VIVPERQLSLAIGREGQNARLAARLTGWRIDIKSDTAVARAELEAWSAGGVLGEGAEGEQPSEDAVSVAQDASAIDSESATVATEAADVEPPAEVVLAEQPVTDPSATEDELAAPQETSQERP